MRRWVVWISLLLLALSLGWFWLLSNDLTFARTDEGRPAVEKKADGKKN